MRFDLQGSRSSDRHWHTAHRTPIHELPKLTTEQAASAESMGWSEESYARSLLASRLTAVDLARKAEKVALLINHWLIDNGVQGEVDRILLRTFAGMYEVTVNAGGDVAELEISEDLIDDLFQRGQKPAAESLDRLLAANFGRLFISKAS